MTGGGDIIQTVLELIRQRLNTHFHTVDARSDDWVVLSNITEPDGRAFAGAKDKVVLFLAGIREQSGGSNRQNTRRTTDGGFVSRPPPLHIDVYVAVVANFYNSNYANGLGMISRTISYFQQHPVFDADTLPGLPAGVPRLSIELQNLGMADANHLFGMMGVKALPMAYYKLRMLPFDVGTVTAVVPATRGVATSGAPLSPDTEIGLNGAGRAAA